MSNERPLRTNTDGLGPGPITGYGPLTGPVVNDERPLTAAGQRLYASLLGGATHNHSYLALIIAIEREAALRAEAARDEGLTRDDVRGLNDAARTLIEALDRHGLGNLALFEQQVVHLRGHLLSDAMVASSPEPVPSENT